MKHQHLKRFLFEAVACTFLFLPQSSLPAGSTLQAGNLPQGEIIEKLACTADASQSYALYLPSHYSPERKWPILYALDAGARGILPVQRFRNAAEKYGYIVAGSNNSRNGPLTIVEDALNAMFKDTGSRFSIDAARVYLTGFSGGARSAVMAGLAMKGRIAGVIGCGAGFPESMPPSPSVPFAFFGIVGMEDFNFPEFRELDRQLEECNVPHQIEVYQGDHEWPPESSCTRAIEWLELHAMKSGTRQKDEALIQEIFDRTRLQAETSQASNRSYDAFLLNSALVKDFAGLRDVTAEAASASRLESSEVVKKSIAKEKDIERRQRRAEEEFSLLVDDARQGRERAHAAQKLTSLLEDLRRDAGGKIDDAGRIAARRVLTRFWIQLSDAGSADLERKDYRLAALMMQLMTHIRPDSAQPYYHLGRALSLSGNRNDAIKALKSAVSRGFRDVEVLESSPDFESLRGEEGFARILEEIRRK